MSLSNFVISEYTEGIIEWFNDLKLPVSAASGYSAVVWIENGNARCVIPNAAEASVGKLVENTLQIWAAPNTNAT